MMKLLKPVIVLTLICLVASAGLAYTNSVTAPIIAENERIAADAARKALLPEADTFSEVEGEFEGVTDAYRADNGAGYVITGTSKGYDGQVPVMVAFGPDGTVASVYISGTSETPGLGKKVEEAGFLSQFTGLTAKTLTLSEIDAITGATISSNAALTAYNYAVSAYLTIKEGE